MRGPYLALLVIVSVAISCQPQQQEPTSLSQEDVAAIRESVASYRDVALAQDFERLATFYTADGVRNAPNAPPSEASPASLRAGYGGVTSLENAPEEIDGRGSLAYARGRYSIIFVSRPIPPASEGEAESISDTGHYVAILRKQEDGRWLMSYLIFNSDQPMPQPEAEE